MNQGLRLDIAGVMPLVKASGLLVSLCTIKQPSGTLGATGTPDGTYSDVAGLVAIPCTAPPLSDKITAVEIKNIEDTLAVQPLHVLLDDYYPTINAGVSAGWIAVIDGTTYDLLGAEHDSQKQMTRLSVRLANV